MTQKGQAHGAWLQDGERKIKADPLTDALDHLYLKGPPESETKQVLARVADELRRKENEVLYYDEIRGTPYDPLFVAVSEQGIIELGFDQSEEAFVARLEKRYRMQLQKSSARVRAVSRQLQDYFSGRSLGFDLRVDLSKLTHFQRQVLTAIQRVPPGETISYGGLARLIGKPKAARAVGRALGTNPIPIIIPCHRALASDGSLGGYSGRGGVGTKQALLELEGAR
jgi:methylated-DNA-[protein]-cysteine S-methyltransferase